jgi:hypothetical protein
MPGWLPSSSSRREDSSKCHPQLAAEIQSKAVMLQHKGEQELQTTPAPLLDHPHSPVKAHHPLRKS